MGNIKKILITGASSGVGLSIAKKYEKEGYDLVLLARRVQKLEEIFSHSEKVKTYKVDISNKNELKRKIEEIIRVEGYIPYVINCAGILHQAKILEFEEEDLDYSLNVNALSPIEIVKFMLPLMIVNNFGRIINLTSGAPLNCFPSFGAYSGSKALLNSLTVTLAKELEGYNIKLNLMSPGPVQSEMSPDAKLMPDICHPTIDYLLKLNKDGANGKFFWLGYEVPLFPDLSGVDWLNGIGNEKLIRIL